MNQKMKFSRWRRKGLIQFSFPPPAVVVDVVVDAASSSGVSTSDVLETLFLKAMLLPATIALRVQVPSV